VASATATATAGPAPGRTAWTRNVAAPVRRFVSTETGGSVFLLAAVVAALIWANVSASSYESVWSTVVSLRVGDVGITEDLRHWINDGLMTFFFLVVGLESRREFDLGELRERRRVTVPVIAALGGLAVPVAIFLAFNAGSHAAHGWGTTMSTDTAFALGLLALVARGSPPRLRAFLLTLFVADDLVGLLVIAFVYSSNVDVAALLGAAGFFALFVTLRRISAVPRPVIVISAVATWVALQGSGVDPAIAGLALGLAVPAYLPARGALEQVTDRIRSFREQPTPELARSAQQDVAAAISPNERAQYGLHPWTSFVIVPLFALANAGISLGGGVLSDAITSPIAIGIFVGYVVGKPVGITAASWVAEHLPSREPRRMPVSWPVLIAGGATAGVGFTLSLLIASIAFKGKDLEAAKVGILATLIGATVTSWIATRAIRLIPPELRARQIAGTVEDIVDLASPVDPERDHIRGPESGPVTLVEYGDYECPYCGQAETVINELLRNLGDEVRYVYRHLPLNDVHQHAQLAAEAAEAAGAQGHFWDMHDKLFEHQDALTPRDLVGYAEELGLDVDRFRDELRRREHAPRVAEDVDDADASRVTGTPTFFINGRRHLGAYDVDTLSREVTNARRRAVVSAGTAMGDRPRGRPGRRAQEQQR
jgi:Na+/H+ antiporter NhaA